jgi:hypothetical protein
LTNWSSRTVIDLSITGNHERKVIVRFFNSISDASNCERDSGEKNRYGYAKGKANRKSVRTNF